MECVYGQSAEARIDEETREEMIRFLKKGKPYGFPCAKIRQRWVAWLEKQGKKETDGWKEGNIIRHGGILALVIKGRRAMKSNGELFTVQYPDEWVKAEPNEIEHFLKELEKQGEEKPKHFELQAGHWYICHRAFCCRADHLTVKEGERFMCEKDGVVKGFVFNEPEKYFKEVCAPAPIEPKFKVGDWVVNNHGEPQFSQVISRSWPNSKIKKAMNNLEIFINTATLDKQYHLWTLQDAKEGDVLASSSSVFILQREDNVGKPTAYCGIMNDGCLVQGQGVCWTNEQCYPATKEQIDLLFQKMHEAGYEWDAEKKEPVKQCEQASDCKVEPKFKVGDWVVNTITNAIEQVIEVTEHDYICSGLLIVSFNDQHLLKRWTIEDAKDGDVLAAHECLVLFKKLDGLNIKCYCTYHFMNHESFFVDTLQNKTAFVPATELQRALIFQKIKEAGYVWDTEQKELQKIEQKPADQVEPKFKVGDWIISDETHEDWHICKITNVENGNYTIESIYGYKGYNTFETFEKSYRLWTINDAKDGDVLSYVTGEEDLWIMIYWSLYEPYDGHVHYHALLVNDNFADKGTCCICIDYLKPATKEQSVLLFRKMKEAGYEWDVEKKELVKQCEQESVIIPKFKVGDKIRRKTPSSFDKDMEVARIDKDYYVCNHIGKFSSQVVKFSEEDSYELVEQKPVDIQSIEKRAHEVFPDDDDENTPLYRQAFIDGAVDYIDCGCKKPSAWSEEDDELYQGVIETELYMLDVANGVKVFDVGNEEIKAECQSELDWLKSLKERVQPRPKQEWKPSDEQIQALDEVYKTHGANNVCRRVLFNLMNDLKKLMEE